MSKVLISTFDQCPNLMSELRVLEMFQGVSRREVVQVIPLYSDPTIIMCIPNRLYVQMYIIAYSTSICVPKF